MFLILLSMFFCFLVRYWLKLYHADTIQNSEFKPGFIDLPIKAVNWLKYFLKQNEHILKNETEVSIFFNKFFIICCASDTVN